MYSPSTEYGLSLRNGGAAEMCIPEVGQSVVRHRANDEALTALALGEGLRRVGLTLSLIG